MFSRKHMKKGKRRVEALYRVLKSITRVRPSPGDLFTSNRNVAGAPNEHNANFPLTATDYAII